jgi:hypothetical protein
MLHLSQLSFIQFLIPNNPFVKILRSIAIASAVIYIQYFYIRPYLSLYLLPVVNVGNAQSSDQGRTHEEYRATFHPQVINQSRYLQKGNKE